MVNEPLGSINSSSYHVVIGRPLIDPQINAEIQTLLTYGFFGMGSNGGGDPFCSGGSFPRGGGGSGSGAGALGSRFSPLSRFSLCLDSELDEDLSRSGAGSLAARI
jgi:hypothetical protein